MSEIFRTYPATIDENMDDFKVKVESFMQQVFEIRPSDSWPLESEEISEVAVDQTNVIVFSLFA